VKPFLRLVNVGDYLVAGGTRDVGIGIFCPPLAYKLLVAGGENLPAAGQQRDFSIGDNRENSIAIAGERQRGFQFGLGTHSQ
jgi:hypothetical protein